MGAGPGLRELKKRMTRDAIANAALRLTIEKGLSNVTVDEIARDAFVSARTVSNYFTAKEEAVLAAGTEGPSQIIEDFAAGATDDAPLKALCELVSRYAKEHPDRLRHTAEVVTLEEDNPSLKPYRAARMAEFEELLRVHVASRTGTDAETDLYPSLVAAAAVAAFMTTLMLWSRAELPDERLPRLIEDAFNIISDGYPHRGGQRGNAVEPAASVGTT